MKARIVSIGVALLALGSSAAVAADIRGPVKAPAFIPPPPVVISWAGFYVGGHVGGAWGNADWITNATLPTLTERVSTDPSGLIGGGQIGYRFQIAPTWLIGIEFAGSFTDLDEVVAANLPPGLTGRTRRTELRSLLSVTGQVAGAWDNWLLYVKGGWATGDVRREANNNNPGGFDVAWSSKQADGWTVGVGVEYALSANISAGIEYDFYSLDVGSQRRANTGGVIVTAGSSTFDIHAIMGRINFRFNVF